MKKFKEFLEVKLQSQYPRSAEISCNVFPALQTHAKPYFAIRYFEAMLYVTEAVRHLYMQKAILTTFWAISQSLYIAHKAK